MPPDPVREETGGGQRITRDSLDFIDPIAWRDYRKVPTTRATRFTGPFEVETREGVLRCPDGYLAVDAHGWPYPIARDEFEAIYELASASSSKEEEGDRRERAYEAALDHYGTLDALVQQHPDQHVALLRDAVDAALGVVAYTGPLKPPAPSVSRQGPSNLASPESIREHERRTANVAQQPAVSQQGTGERERELLQALRDAISLAENGWYFTTADVRKKYDVDAEIAELRAIVSASSQQKGSEIAQAPEGEQGTGDNERDERDDDAECGVEHDAQDYCSSATESSASQQKGGGDG